VRRRVRPSRTPAGWWPASSGLVSPLLLAILCGVVDQLLVARCLGPCITRHHDHSRSQSPVILSMRGACVPMHGARLSRRFEVQKKEEPRAGPRTGLGCLLECWGRLGRASIPGGSNLRLCGARRSPAAGVRLARGARLAQTDAKTKEGAMAYGIARSLRIFPLALCEVRSRFDALSAAAASCAGAALYCL
jgi:hypothetical protein